MTISKKKILNFIVLWLPPVLWGLLIFSFSSFTTPRVSQEYWYDFVVKKSAHVVEYGVLATLLFRAFKGSGKSLKYSIIGSLAICVLYAFTDEFHQSFTPGREPKIRDVAIDGGGSSFFLYIVSSWLPRTEGKINDLAKAFGLV